MKVVGKIQISSCVIHKFGSLSTLNFFYKRIYKLTFTIFNESLLALHHSESSGSLTVY